MDYDFAELDLRLDNLSKIINTNCVWKRTIHCMTETRLKNNFMHTHSFCTEIKKTRNGQQRCRFNDTDLIAKLIVKENFRPFLYTCHAGATELVVPICSGEIIFGCTLCGPFRSKSVLENSKLPIWCNEFYDSLPNLVKWIIAPLVEKLYSFYPSNFSHDRRIEATLNFIAGNYRKKITLEMAATRICLSPSRLSHLFKNVCGTDFTTYLTSMRLKIAADLLTFTDLPISEISEQSGFKDQAHFATSFRNSYQLSPTSFRKLKQRY